MEASTRDALSPVSGGKRPVRAIARCLEVLAGKWDETRELIQADRAKSDVRLFPDGATRSYQKIPPEFADRPPVRDALAPTRPLHRACRRRAFSGPRARC